MLWFLMLTWVWLAFESKDTLKCTCGCGCRCVMMLWARMVCVCVCGRSPEQNLHRWISMCLQNKPAAVIFWVPLQRGGGPRQAQPGEGVVVRELCVRQTGHAIWLVIHILPVRVQRRRPLGKWSKQIGIQLVHYLLVHAGFKLSGKEGGPRSLLQREREGKVKGRGREENRTARQGVMW